MPHRIQSAARRRRAIVFLLAAFAATPAAAAPLAPPPQPRTTLPEVSLTHSDVEALRNLPGVAVHVERVSQIVRRLGVTEDWLTRRIVAALDRDSVPRLTTSDAATDPRQPVLVLRLETTPLPDRAALGWHLSLGVHRRVTTRVDPPRTMMARTWEARTELGVTSDRDLRTSIASSLDDQLEEFVRDWRKRAREE